MTPTAKVSNTLTFVLIRTRWTGLWDELLSEGAVTTTHEQLLERTGSSPGSVRVAVAEAQRRHLLFSPVRGLYVLVPPQYRRQGTVPADWFLDDMCRHLSRGYYLGYLSAAARHGAAHQAAQVAQTVVDRAVADRTSPPRMSFYTDARMAEWPTEKTAGPTGSLEVATPETCAFDLAQSPARGGGASNVATVLRDLALDESKLAEQALRRPRAAARRLGFLLDRVQRTTPTAYAPTANITIPAGLASVTASAFDLGALEEAAGADRNRTLLDPGGPRRGALDKRWHVIENTTVEPDE